MSGLWPSGLALGLAALAAAWLVAARSSPPELDRRVDASRALAVALVLQGLHFAEEAATGFDARLGALFGLPGMSRALFVAFNVGWLGIWAASVPAVRRGLGFGLFAGWFLAIAGTLNAVAHPLLAVASGGYFPGLATSPFVGAAGLWLGSRLLRATAPRAAGEAPPPS